MVQLIEISAIKFMMALEWVLDPLSKKPSCSFTLTVALTSKCVVLLKVYKQASLCFKWNLIRLCGPGHGIVTTIVYKR